MNPEKVRKEIISTLRSVVDPELGTDVVELGLIDEISVDPEGHVLIKMHLTTPFCPFAMMIVGAVKAAAETVDGVKKVSIELLPYKI